MPNTNDNELARHVAGLRDLSRRLVRELGVHEPLEGCTVRDCHAMIELEQHGVLTAKQLARHLLLQKSTISRKLSRLDHKGLVRVRRDSKDGRYKTLELTGAGKNLLERVNHAADDRVNDALGSMTAEQRDLVLEGFQLYVDALARTKLRGAPGIRPIRRTDDADIAYVIRSVMTEYELNQEGFAFFDPEVDRMYDSYGGAGHAYFVATVGEYVVGGAGIGALNQGPEKTCELRKMYLLREARGRGLGKRLLDICLAAAREHGYTQCYLETMPVLKTARALYESAGFRQIEAAMGDTGHSACQNYYLLELG